MSVGFEPLPLLSVLVRHNVDFLLIGGVAADIHGSTSVTFDLDLCYERSRENLARLATALRELGAELRGAPPGLPFQLDAETLRAGDSFTFTTTHGDLDVLATPSGTRGYDELARNAISFDLDGTPVHVASLEDLIRMKTAAGRPKDRVELEILGALRDELEGRASEP